MLLSQKEERGRRFKLALRAGMPVLTLIFLVSYTTISQKHNIDFTVMDIILVGAITFIAIYFIYFLMNLSVQETMIDATSQGFNKKAFIAKLEACHPQSLAFIKIENLETLNENYGSEQIDILLYNLTNTLNLVFKQHGLDKVIIGRYHGAEFLIALNETHLNIEMILNKMVENYQEINGMEIEYKFAIITNTNENLDKSISLLHDMIQSQTKELQESSTGKKDNNTISKDAKELSTIEEDIIIAIQKEKLVLSFRPLFNTKVKEITQYEIAVKLKSTSSKDTILPRIFLPVINRLGLGRDYDLLLMKHVIDLLPLIDEKISFTFNISPFSLRDGNFQKNLFKYLNSKKVTHSRLIIQLYERETHHDLSKYLKVLKNFRTRGIRICIDNFGSSNASMEYMKHFKFDMVQFDRDYVTQLDDNTTYSMLNSLVTMSKDLKVQTVAKWVDNEEQKSKLIDLGIDYLQGFGIDKPINENALIEKYNS